MRADLPVLLHSGDARERAFRGRHSVLCRILFSVQHSVTRLGHRIGTLVKNRIPISHGSTPCISTSRLACISRSPRSVTVDTGGSARRYRCRSARRCIRRRLSVRRTRGRLVHGTLVHREKHQETTTTRLKFSRHALCHGVRGCGLRRLWCCRGEGARKLISSTYTCINKVCRLLWIW